MEWGSLFAFVIVNALPAYSIPKEKGECIHGGILRNSYLEDFKSTNHSRVENVDSMKYCVEKCCRIRDCDIALMDSRRCFSVNCAKENSCRVRHSTSPFSDEESEISFILSKSMPDEEPTPSSSPAKSATKASSTSTKKQSKSKKDSRNSKRKKRRKKKRKRNKSISVKQVPLTSKGGVEKEEFSDDYTQDSEASGSGEASGESGDSQDDETSGDDNAATAFEDTTSDQTINKVPDIMQASQTNYSSYLPLPGQDKIVQKGDTTRDATKETSTNAFLGDATDIPTNQTMASPVQTEYASYANQNASSVEPSSASINALTPTNQLPSSSISNQQTNVTYSQSNPNVPYSPISPSTDTAEYSGDRTEYSGDETSYNKQNSTAEGSSQVYSQADEGSQSKSQEPTNTTFLFPSQPSNETYYQADGNIYTQSNQSESKPDDSSENEIENETTESKENEESSTDVSGSGYYEASGEANMESYQLQSQLVNAGQLHATSSSSNPSIQTNSETKYHNQEHALTQSDNSSSGMEAIQPSKQAGVLTIQPSNQVGYASETKGETLETVLDELNPGYTSTNSSQPPQQVEQAPYSSSNIADVNTGYYQTNQTYAPQHQIYSGFSTEYSQPNQTYYAPQYHADYGLYAQPSPNTASTPSALQQGQPNGDSDKASTNEPTTQSNSSTSDDGYGSASDGDESSSDFTSSALDANLSSAKVHGFVQSKPATAFAITRQAHMEGEDTLPANNGAMFGHGGDHVASGSGTFEQVATPEGYLTPLTQEINQDSKNMKHFDAPVNEIDVENLGVSGVSPQDDVDDANSSISQPEVNLTNIRPTEHGNMIVIDNDTVIKVEKMQDEDKFNDDEEASGSATGLHKSDDLAQSDDGISGDMMLTRKSNESSVTDIEEESGDEMKNTANDTSKGEDSFQDNVSDEEKPSDNENANSIKGGGKTNLKFPYVNITISPQAAKTTNEKKIEPVGITIATNEKKPGTKGNETSSDANTDDSTNSTSNILININTASDTDEDTDNSSGSSDQVESGSGSDAYILDGPPPGEENKQANATVADTDSGQVVSEGSGLSSTGNNNLDHDQLNKDITGKDDGALPLTPTSNNAHAPRLNDDGSNIETTNELKASAQASPSTLHEGHVLTNQSSDSGDMQKETQVGATVSNTSSKLALTPPNDADKEENANISDSKAPSKEEDEDGTEEQSVGNSSKVYSEGSKVIKEGQMLAAANSKAGLYTEGTRVIEEGKQQAKANRTYASNLKPLNGEASIDSENNPDSSDNGEISEEENKTPTEYPTTGNKTKLPNETARVKQAGRKIATANNTHQSTTQAPSSEANFKAEGSSVSQDNSLKHPQAKVEEDGEVVKEEEKGAETENAKLTNTTNNSTNASAPELTNAGTNTGASNNVYANINPNGPSAITSNNVASALNNYVDPTTAATNAATSTNNSSAGASATTYNGVDPANNSTSPTNANVVTTSQSNPHATSFNDVSTTQNAPSISASPGSTTPTETESLFPEQWLKDVNVGLGGTPKIEPATMANQSAPSNYSSSYHATKDIISEIDASSGLDGFPSGDDGDKEDSSGSGQASEEGSLNFNAITSTNKRKKGNDLVDNYLSKNNSVHYKYSDTTLTGMESERDTDSGKQSKEMKLLLSKNVSDHQSVNHTEHSGSGEDSADSYLPSDFQGMSDFDESDNTGRNDTQKDKESSSGSGENIQTSGIGNIQKGQHSQSSPTLSNIINDHKEKNKSRVPQKKEDAIYDENLFSGATGDFDDESDLIGDAISSSGDEEMNDAFSSSEFSGDAFAESQSGSGQSKEKSARPANETEQGNMTSSNQPVKNITHKSEQGPATPVVNGSYIIRKDEEITSNIQFIPIHYANIANLYHPSEDGNIYFTTTQRPGLLVNTTYTKRKEILIGQTGLRDTIEKSSSSERSKLTTGNHATSNINKKLQNNNIISNDDDSDIDVIDIVGMHPHIRNKTLGVDDPAKKRTILDHVDTIIRSGEGTSHHNTLVTYDEGKMPQVTQPRSIIPTPIAFDRENDISAVMHVDLRSDAPSTRNEITRSSTPNITWTTYNGSQIIAVPTKDAGDNGTSSKDSPSSPNYAEEANGKSEKTSDSVSPDTGKQGTPNITWTTYNGSQIIPVPLKSAGNGSASGFTEKPAEAGSSFTNITWATYDGMQIVPVKSGGDSSSSKNVGKKIGKASKKEIKATYDPDANITWSTYNGSQIIPVQLKSDSKSNNSSQKETEHAEAQTITKQKAKQKKTYKKKEEKASTSSTPDITWTTYNGSQIIPVSTKSDDKNGNTTVSSAFSPKTASSSTPTSENKAYTGDTAPNITWTSYNGSQIIPVALKPERNVSKEQKELPKVKEKGQEYATKNQHTSSSSSGGEEATSSAPNITWTSYNGSQIIAVPVKSKGKSGKTHSYKTNSKKPSKKDVVQKVKSKKAAAKKSGIDPVNLIPLGGVSRVSRRNRLKSAVSQTKSRSNRKRKKKSHLKPSKVKNVIKIRKKAAKRQHANGNEYNHGHPMAGHRYGGAEFNSIHKNANHEKTSSSGHYGQHNNMQDNHDETDIFSDRYPPQDGYTPPKTKKSFVRHADRGGGDETLTTTNRYFTRKGPEVAQTCVPGLTLRGATLRGGILSGDFKSMGVVETQKKCVHLCCKSKRCDVAMTVGRECINIRCFDKNACAIAPAGTLYDNAPPVATFVQHVTMKDDYLFSKRSDIPHLTRGDALVDEVDSFDQSIDLQEILNEVDRLGW